MKKCTDSARGHSRRRVHNLPPRVGPGAKLEVALLVVKGEPGDVDLAGRLQRIDMMSIITLSSILDECSTRWDGCDVYLRVG